MADKQIFPIFSSVSPVMSCEVILKLNIEKKIEFQLSPLQTEDVPT